MIVNLAEIGKAEKFSASAPQITALTKLEYMDRFTDDELAGIYSAAKNSIQVEIWLERFKLATEVDLTDPRTVSGVQALEAAGLIGQGRSVEILMGSVSTEAVVEITAP